MGPIDLINPVIKGPADLLAGSDNRDELRDAIQQGIEMSRRANEQLDYDYSNLMKDFDLTLGNFRQESVIKRNEASANLRSELNVDTDTLLASFGPLDETTSARLRNQIRAPALSQMLEFDMGTYDNDVGMALSSLVGSLTLQRERETLKSNSRAIAKRNKAALEGVLDSQPNDMERFLTGSMRGLQLGGALKGML